MVISHDLRCCNPLPDYNRAVVAAAANDAGGGPCGPSCAAHQGRSLEAAVRAGPCFVVLAFFSVCFCGGGRSRAGCFAGSQSVFCFGCKHEETRFFLGRYNIAFNSRARILTHSF